MKRSSLFFFTKNGTKIIRKQTKTCPYYFLDLGDLKNNIWATGHKTKFIVIAEKETGVITKSRKKARL